MISGIYLTYKSITREGQIAKNPSRWKRALISKNGNMRPAEANLVVKPESFHYLDQITNLLGISRSAVILEVITKIIFLSILMLITSEVLDLTFFRSLFLIFVSASFFTFWMVGYRKRTLNRYRLEFEIDFADFVESLSLAVNSGLPLITAVTRVIQEFQEEESSKRSSWFRRARKSPSSPIVKELGVLSSRIAAGDSIQRAFDLLASRLHSSALSNFTDIISINLARGTPLAAHLSEHALSIREGQKRALLDRAGRAEVKMMVPVVFLLLPISVLFALWPSFQQLQQLVTVT